MSEAIIHCLTPKQENAILALLHEPSLTKAAAAAQVNERTLYRWLHEQTFASAYREARRQAFSQAVAQTQHYAPLAVNTLVRLMADNATPAHVRVTAAATLLKFGRDGIELEDLAARIDALEKTSQVGEPGQPPLPPPPPNPWSDDTDGAEPGASATGVAA